ncbi:MAG: hypothetical protein K0Q63_3467 [Paenibacillus sp.]|nr:hypothetical protein [Paenibacillus sp.]
MVLSMRNLGTYHIIVLLFAHIASPDYEHNKI